MGRIRLLPDEVASQVAAGEVVERPASVVKELVENAIDAGARRIRVEFQRGGAAMVRVTDDGCGMDREDALLSLERHATSKIRSAADLAAVGTMGFRGEALPSIASVSRFRLVTRPRDAECGTQIVVAGGRVESVADSGEAPGTLVEVASLFFNLPARRKFLRGEETEAAHIAGQVQMLALAHPSVAVTLVRDGRVVFEAAATQDAAVRVRDVLGSDFLHRLLPIEPCEMHGIYFSGFLAKPGEGRPDRDQQFLILNRRVIHCPAISGSLREAYGEVLPKGRHPLAVLQIAMDPLAFDCNVHPAKREVRLHRPDLVRQAVFQLGRATLARTVPPVAARPVPIVEAPDVPPEPPRAVLPSPQPEPGLPIAERPSGADELPYRIIGPLAEAWLLLEGPDGLVLVDTRAASERILFETLRRDGAAGRVASQRLLLPEVVEVGPKDVAWISAEAGALAGVGFAVEAFGGTAVKVEAVPACLDGRDPRSALLEVCESVRASGGLSKGETVSDRVIRSVSRFAALDRFVYDEMRARRLVAALLACELPYACPQGRPTMIQWAFPELERKFGRAG